MTCIPFGKCIHRMVQECAKHLSFENYLGNISPGNYESLEKFGLT